MVDSERRIILPPEMASRYGFRPGAEIFIDEVMNGLRLRMPVTHLAKVYVEPTNRCNLECRICMRHEWKACEGFLLSPWFSSVDWENHWPIQTS